nr:hypothetical protein [Tanacetum cinerariifolium]
MEVVVLRREQEAAGGGGCCGVTSGGGGVNGGGGVRWWQWSVGVAVVPDMSKVNKNKARRTKLGTGMKRVQEIEAEGEFISNLILLILYP